MGRVNRSRLVLISCAPTAGWSHAAIADTPSAQRRRASLYALQPGSVPAFEASKSCVFPLMTLWGTHWLSASVVARWSFDPSVLRVVVMWAGRW